ncbi:MAG: CaiB/BaiF CoA-transferase family protein [Alphaproteobacteria bacterium]|nr:CaiB/BaiF CoA-transferase family protein [Alphaproteobacteria bacterium]
MGLPLRSVRVLDLTRVLAGPWATQLLADLGAEVIKVERPGSGDDTRGWGPPFVDGDGRPGGVSAYFLCTNRGKRSVTVDMETPEGRTLVADLAAECDIMVENLKVGSLAKLGLDYASLARRNPRLIYCSITGFGQTGPHKDRTGYDLLVQAMGGLMSVTGEADGPPTKVGVATADLFTGLYASNAILAALMERQESGLGQHIDLALLDVQIATLVNQASGYLASGKVPGRHGNAHPNIVPYQSFSARDGHIVVAVGNDTQFVRFAEVMGRPDLATDPRFSVNSARVIHRAELLAIIEPLIAARTASDILGALDRVNIPAGPINRLDQVFADPQIAARGLVVEPEAGATGKRSPVVGNPIRFSRTPIDSAKPAPLLGADSDEVLRAVLGKSETEIESLRKNGVI